MLQVLERASQHYDAGRSRLCARAGASTQAHRSWGDLPDLLWDAMQGRCQLPDGGTDEPKWKCQEYWSGGAAASFLSGGTLC